MIDYIIFSNEGSREINEDRAGVATFDGAYCFAVADGLGGHGNGEIAAQLAVDAVCTLFAEQGYSDSFFEQAFLNAQNSILAEQNRTGSPSKMKTTLVILVIKDSKAVWAHVGDSRLYCFKHDKIKKRTIDHSVPQMLAISGEIKEKDIRHHPDRNRLMRVMGVQGEKPNYDVSPEMKLFGEYSFLLCTDGFWELIEDDEMEDELKDSYTPNLWLEKMSKDVLENGSGTEMDNYTAIAVNVKGKTLFERLL